MIVQHLEECKEDWMFEEYIKPESERVLLPPPPSQFVYDYEMIKKHLVNTKEQEKELPRSLSPMEDRKKETVKIEDLKIVEGGLVECPT